MTIEDIAKIPLNPNERLVVEQCVIGNRTLVSVAKEMNRSVVRVYQIRNKAMRRIKWHLENPLRVHLWGVSKTP